MAELKANPNRKARGGIIEAKLDKGRGPVATVLVQNGTLRVGDMIVAGTAYGRVRAMVNDRGERVKSAGPSMPVEVIGFNDVPSAGDTISAVDDDRLSRQVAEERKDKLRAALIKSQTEDQPGRSVQSDLRRPDQGPQHHRQGRRAGLRRGRQAVAGEAEQRRGARALHSRRRRRDHRNRRAAGLRVQRHHHRLQRAPRTTPCATWPSKEGVDIRLYRVIYNAIEDVENAMKGMLAPKFKETALGRAQVRQTFKITGIGHGRRLLRDRGQAAARRSGPPAARQHRHRGHQDRFPASRFKDDAKEVAAGYECGATLENYSDIKENDVIECYLMEEIQQ